MKKIITIIIPIAFQNLIAFIASEIDILMLGKISGNAFSACNLANQVFFLATLVISGVSAGCNILSSQYWGREDRKSIYKVMSYGLGMVIFFVGLLSIICFLRPESVMSLFTNIPELISIGAEYLKIACIYYVFYGISSVITQTLRSVHNIKPAVLFSIITLIVNAFLNYCLIFGNFGFEALELRGAAIATVIARLIEMVLVLFYLLAIEKNLHVRIHDLFAFDKTIFRLYLLTAIPVIFSETLWGLGESVLVAFIGRLNEDIIHSYSIYNVVSQVAGILMGGCVSAGCIMIGNELGAGKDIRPLSKALDRLAIGVGVFDALIVIMSIFIMPMLYELTPQALIYMRLILLVGIVIEFYRPRMCMVQSGVLRGMGDVNFCFLNDTLWLWFYIVPLAYFTIFHTSLPFFICFFIMKSDQITKLFTARHRREKLFKKQVKALV